MRPTKHSIAADPERAARMIDRIGRTPHMEAETVTATAPMIRSEIVTVDEATGDVIAETVDLSVSDFAEFSLQESASLEEMLDRADFDALLDGELGPAEFARRPALARAVLYAKIRAGVKDPRVRRSMTVEDFDVDLAQLAALLTA